jgi:hypothetical protein
MESNNLYNSIDKYLSKKSTTIDYGKEKEVCDSITGECYIVREKDGIVERINKKYLTEDGRQLLQD